MNKHRIVRFGFAVGALLLSFGALAQAAAPGKSRDITIVLATVPDTVEPCNMMTTGDTGIVLRQNVVESLTQLDPKTSAALPLLAMVVALLGIDEVRLREESNVSYWREPEQAVAQVTNGKAQLAFFLTPTPVLDVKAVADAKSRMPQKSTDFYPKLLSGMTIYEVR